MPPRGPQLDSPEQAGPEGSRQVGGDGGQTAFRGLGSVLPAHPSPAPPAPGSSVQAGSGSAPARGGCDLEGAGLLGSAALSGPLTLRRDVGLWLCDPKPASPALWNLVSCGSTEHEGHSLSSLKKPVLFEGSHHPPGNPKTWAAFQGGGEGGGGDMNAWDLGGSSGWREKSGTPGGD